MHDQGVSNILSEVKKQRKKNKKSDKKQVDSDVSCRPSLAVCRLVVVLLSLGCRFDLFAGCHGRGILKDWSGIS